LDAQRDGVVHIGPSRYLSLGGNVVRGAAGALVTVSRDDHNHIVEERKDLDELIM